VLDETPGRCYHIISAEIEATDQRKFHVLIDNILYGPFSKIRIGPNQSRPEEEITHIPIMTYYPLELPS